MDWLAFFSLCGILIGFGSNRFLLSGFVTRWVHNGFWSGRGSLLVISFFLILYHPAAIMKVLIWSDCWRFALMLPLKTNLANIPPWPSQLLAILASFHLVRNTARIPRAYERAAQLQLTRNPREKSLHPPSSLWAVGTRAPGLCARGWVGGGCLQHGACTVFWKQKQIMVELGGGRGRDQSAITCLLLHWNWKSSQKKSPKF